MNLLTLLCGLALLATSVLGITTTGVTGGPVGIRYEIRQLAKSQPKQLTLFLLAMDQFQKQPQTSVGGYYQIAGIHGVPITSYDGVNQCGNCRGAIGYCTHDSILFLGWHRAYLALFEQQLVAIAKTIANQYPSSVRAGYVSAAQSLRLPYWDWAAKPPSGSNLPIQLTQKTVRVTGPQGQKTMDNPLFRFTFQNPSNLVYSPWKTWQHTLRYPTSNDKNAGSNTAKAIAAFNNIRGSLQDQLYQIFSTCDEFSEVGLDTVSTGTKRCSNSLEQIHNTVHNTAGGLKHNGIQGGHMTILPLAAFDPIFWLHHCNIDRLFAMWQAVNPNSYSGSQVAPATTWTIAKGSTQNLNSPLTPFRRSGNTFHSSNSVRKWQSLGYTYPEFAHSDGSKASITRYINNLYGPGAGATAGSSKRDLLGEVITPLVANNGSLFQYVANIETPRYALNGSYSIYLFNGNPASEDPASWVVDQNLIGPMGVTASTTMAGSDLVAAGSIPLTRTLTDVVGGGLLPDLTEAAVVPFLEKNLEWRIAGPDGSSVDPDTIPDFDLTVYASTATQPAADELPEWSDFIELADVTSDRLKPVPSASAAPSGSATPSATASQTPDATTASDAENTTEATDSSQRRRRSVRAL